MTLQSFHTYIHTNRYIHTWPSSRPIHTHTHTHIHTHTYIHIWPCSYFPAILPRPVAPDAHICCPYSSPFFLRKKSMYAYVYTFIYECLLPLLVTYFFFCEKKKNIMYAYVYTFMYECLLPLLVTYIFFWREKEKHNVCVCVYFHVRMSVAPTCHLYLFCRKKKKKSVYAYMYTFMYACLVPLLAACVCVSVCVGAVMRGFCVWKEQGKSVSHRGRLQRICRV